MSSDVNTQLFERAAEMVDYYEGTVIAKVIEKNIEDNDLDALRENVTRAEAQASEQEFESADVL